MEISMTHLTSSELILNPDGSIYHLRLKPEQIGDLILLVGDQDRVAKVAAHFDGVELEIQRREFRTITGSYRGMRLSVISTGIGTDNIDIVLNELDALVNIDLENRVLRNELKRLTILRLGTCGSLQDDIPLGEMVFSEYSVGLDGLMSFYEDFPHNEKTLTNALVEHLGIQGKFNALYSARADSSLIEAFGAPEDVHMGITMTANGFYGPQGRKLRLDLRYPGLNEAYRSFSYNSRRILNYEMESSALAALGSALGHHCGTLCTVIANRAQGKAESKHNDPIDHMIKTALQILVPDQRA
jgi:uridine phosphorylase